MLPALFRGVSELDTASRSPSGLAMAKGQPGPEMEPCRVSINPLIT